MERLRRLDVFAVVEKLLTAAALVLVAITVGGQLGPMLDLDGRLGHIAGWSIALVYDALWIGALRMSEVAIRQRSRVGMAVMLGLSLAALGVSTGTLLILGHAKVFAFVPLAAALFMALRLFVGNVLADGTTANEIAGQSAADRNARALAAADARHLRATAVTDVVTETAGHLGEMERQIARAETLTLAEARIAKARAKAEKRLQKADKKHGEKAAAFATRTLTLAVSTPDTPVSAAVTAPDTDRPAITATPVPETGPDTATTHPVTTDDTQVTDPTDTATDAAETGATLAELAAVAGVSTPAAGEPLTNTQIDVVLRHLRYTDDPPRSYRHAQKEFRDRGFVGSDERLRRVWAALVENEETLPTTK